MKKTYTLLCIAATMLAACAKENLVENDTTPQDEEVKYIDVSFDAEFPEPVDEDGTKTMLDDKDLSVLWCDGDQIAVNDNGKTAKTDLTTFNADINPQDSHKATFSGKINEKAENFFAVYPAANVEVGSFAGLGTGKIYTVLPNSQTATVGSFTNKCALSYAYGTVSGGIIQDKIEFHNLCSILEFTMPDYVVGAQTVNIRSNNGTIMSGGCVIDRNNFEFNSFTPSKEKKDYYDYVTVTAPNTASKFYAVIFPVNYSNGFTITVTTAGGQTYSRNVTKALNAQPNHIYNLGTLGVVLDEQKVDLTVNIDQNIKTGSVATFEIAAKDDFKAMVKSWDISLYNSDDQLVRKIEGNTTGEGTLDVVGDYKLLAAGDYYAKVSYFMQTGSKREGLSFTGFKAEQFKVEGVVINATPTLNYEGSTLNGTDVELSFDISAVDPDLAKLIHWTDITLTDKNSVTYRTATAAGKMTPASGKPYLPNGDYTLTAYFTLPELGSTEPTPLDPKTITVNLTPTFGVNITSAKTSYDYYKAGSIDTANGCNNMGIYELAANITGLSSAVATQMGINYIWYLDNQNIGTSDGQGASVYGINLNTTGAKTFSFGSKKVKCQANFDTVTKDSENIDVAITGLPYKMPDKKIYNVSDDWILSGESNSKYKDDNYLQLGRDDLSANKTKTATCTFYAPASINLSITYKIYIHSYWAFGDKDNTCTFLAGPIQVLKETVSGNKEVQHKDKTNNNAYFTTDNAKISVTNSNGYSSGYTQIYYIDVLYR